jgi:two-component system cell cycle sensor histidine kinase/response regulator CckA
MAEAAQAPPDRNPVVETIVRSVPMPSIAIVDQEALVTLDIAKTLERAGYGAPVRFERGGDFLKALRSGARWDLILVDVDLADEATGPEVAVAARKEADIPAVLITALSDARPGGGAMEAQPLGILVKPFSERELLGTAEIALVRAGMEKKLSYSEKRYRSLFDLGISPRCIADDNGIVLEANASFSTLFACRGQEATLPTLFARPEDWSDVSASIASGRTVPGREYDMVDGRKGRLSVLASFYGFREAETGRALLSAEFSDLTESRRLRDELQQAQKMEAMGRLAGGIAHDFNNILTAIVGHAEMLKLDIGSDEPAYEDVIGIAKTAGRASQLTRQLLGFSRKQPYSPKRISVTQAVRDAASLLRKLAGESILFSTMLPEGDPMAYADPVQIEQVLINLVVNARDALEGRSGGRITVLVESRRLSAAASIGATNLPPGDYAVIEVSDNGVGIPEEIAGKIFDPFFTTKAAGKGTGLGLAIVSSVAAQTGGAIGLKSKPGEGTTFSLWLPLADKGSAEAAHDSTAASAVETSGKVVESGDGAAQSGRVDLSLPGNPAVLIVDDDETVLGFLSYALFKAGATVISARNAGEAMILAERHRFDLLVADINLPGLDGVELFARLSAGRGEQGALPCVFISGRIDETVSLPEGAAFLEKPFTPGELIATMRGALGSA